MSAAAQPLQAPPSRAPLSRSAIVQKAIQLIEAEDVESLSMRRLGAALGVEAMSLYRYVPNKAALLHAVRAQLLEDIRLEGEAVGWRGYLLALARGMRDLLSAHPGALPLFTQRPPRENVSIEVAETLFRRMRDVGMPPALRLHALDAVASLVIGHALSRASRQAPSAAVKAERFPAVAEVLEATRVYDVDQSFEVGLSALLDGLEQARARLRR